MKVDLLLETFGTEWPDVREAAVEAELLGFDGIWVNDHLAGSVQNADHVLECWTVLSALAATVPRMTLGPLVLNVANRDPGTLAVMAATLQHVSGGRLLMGLGAGARVGSTYATEQEALGRPVPSAAERRRSVEGTVDMLHRVWSGVVPPATGFLKPHPIPPIVIAATGPKTAELAGRKGDGVCFPVGPSMRELLELARRAAADSGRRPDDLLVTASLSSWPNGNAGPSVWPDVDRLIVSVSPPLDEAVARLSEVVARW